VIDLHCHTDFSDGSLDPLELVDHALRVGIETLAITDHDSLEGYDLARQYAEARGLRLVCGVELSTHCRWSSRSAHLLGYFQSDPGASFRAWLEVLREGRRRRNAALLHKLRDLGIALSMEELQAIAHRQLGRPHFARLLVEKGYAVSLREAFAVYLGETGLAWVDREEPLLEEAIARVSAAGGVASLAHPVRIGTDPVLLEDVVRSLKASGLEAIECFHPEHSAADTETLSAIAARHGLAITGGSDFHGSYKPEVHLGTGKGDLAIPAACLENLRRLLARKQAGNSGASAVQESNEYILQSREPQ
jgi:predicted metal-dependent phosphoesterase TrpH